MLNRLLLIFVSCHSLLLCSYSVSVLALVLLLSDLNEEEIVDVVVAVHSLLRVFLENLISIPGAIKMKFGHLLCKLRLPELVEVLWSCRVGVLHQAEFGHPSA